MSLKLEVGEFYLNAIGEIVKINIYNKNNLYPFISLSGMCYKENGAYDIFIASCVFDLIAHIPKELHHHICSMVSAYHTQPNYAEKVNLTFGIFNMKVEEEKESK